MSGFARRARGGELPVIHQNEIAECGLACVAMIAAYHGHDVDMAGMRRRFAVSIKGATLSRLIAIADRLDLAARPLRAEPEHLPELDPVDLRQRRRANASHRGRVHHCAALRRG